ncbi:hypothetical protein HZB03_02130 [Candidatus Woesearchaeota archaeon]|nr:hypothetical protein [Candidatus Woesearchaeota archaeon]
MDGKEIFDKMERGQFVNDPEVTVRIDRLAILYHKLTSEPNFAQADPDLRELVKQQYELLDSLRGTVTPENLTRYHAHVKNTIEFVGRYNAELGK